MFRHAVFETPVGWMGIVRSPFGICHTVLPRGSVEEVGALLVSFASASGYTLADEPEDHRLPLFAPLVDRLVRYFAGERVDFDERPDFSAATEFQRQAWRIARTIPYGQCRSYRWVAQQMGRPRAYRAVGRAMAANPVPPIIPCHRVLRSDGTLGGFSGGLGLKRHMLQLEGIPLRG